jgi:large subunit ribosomal protein L32e
MAPKKKEEKIETPVKAEKKPAKKAKAPAPKKAEPKVEKKAKKAQPKVEEKPVEAEVKPVDVVEEKKEEPVEKKPFTTAKPRPLPRPLEKSTLDLDAETKRLLGARKTNKASLPAFPRIDSHKKAKLAIGWRKPKGHHSQLRRQRKAKGSLVKIGFGSPAAVRGLHSSGYEEVLVYRPEDVKGITKTQAIRVGGTVGKKKQVEIEKAAKELNIKVLNPLNVFEEV